MIQVIDAIFDVFIMLFSLMLSNEYFSIVLAIIFSGVVTYFIGALVSRNK